MWAISGGSSAPPVGDRQAAEHPLVDEPQLAALGGARRGRTGPGGAARRGRRAAGRGSGRSCRGGRAARRRCRAAARSTCRGGGRPRSRRPVSAAAKPAGPRGSRRTGRGCSTSTRVDGGADDVALEAGADDLDLGQLGHAGVSSPAGLSRRADDGEVEHAEADRDARRTPSRRRPARLPSWSGRRRCRRGRSPTRTWAVKVFMWSGPSSSMTYSGTPRPCSAESSCREVFQSRPAPSAEAASMQRVEEQVHDAGRRPRSRR